MKENIGSKIPENCRYWRYQGDHNLIGCRIDGTLCNHDDCNLNRVDPTGLLRKRIDQQKQIGGKNE